MKPSKFEFFDGLKKIGAFTLENKVVTETSDHPNARAMKGWTQESVKEWTTKCGWKIKKVIA